MIITRLIGGLGNQMFQYAAGRRLAHHHKTDLFLDVTGFASYAALRKYELDHFRINAAIAPLDLLKQVSFSRKDTVRLGFQHLFFGKKIIQFIKDQPPDFHEQILSLPDNIYLDGYWQSEKYFAGIADMIKKEFSFVYPPSEINQELLEKITDDNSVSLHIRRGDYVSNPESMETHGVLGAEYYREALNLMEKKVKDPQIFVFSDDIPWAKDNLKTDLPVHCIDHNGMEKNYEDLRLMSNCKYHIIANSSFSWWGAWLSINPGKIVIAPEKWFSEQEMKKRKKIDVVPDNWIKI
jgi:hypothetical protein